MDQNYTNSVCKNYTYLLFPKSNFVVSVFKNRFCRYIVWNLSIYTVSTKAATTYNKDLPKHSESFLFREAP